MMLPVVEPALAQDAVACESFMGSATVVGVNESGVAMSSWLPAATSCKTLVSGTWASVREGRQRLLNQELSASETSFFSNSYPTVIV